VSEDNNSSESARGGDTRDNREQGFAKKLGKWWDRFSFDVANPINVFTLLLVIAGGLQWWTLSNTDETLRLQQRAWVEFVGADIIPPNPAKDDGISFALKYINTGREPGTGVNIFVNVSEIDAFDPKFTNMRDVTVPQNSSCNNLSVTPNSFILPPTGLGTLESIIYNSIQANPRTVASAKLISGEKYYVFEGCLAYATQGKTHFASFCYILENALRISFNPFTGQVIQLAPGQEETRFFRFEACAAGFNAT
jgi:hypothetical protein